MYNHGMAYVFLLIGGFLLFWSILPVCYETYHIGTLIGIFCALLYLSGFFLYSSFLYRIVILILTVYLLQISIRMILACFHKPDEDDILLVLGAHFIKDRPSTIMRERIQRAEIYLKEHPQAFAVLSGGKTSDEPWAEAMEMDKMLKERGIDRKRLIKEEKSVTTAENMRFSASLLQGRKAAVVTNEFHMYVTPQIVVDSFGVLISPECVCESARNQHLPQITGGRTACYCRHDLRKVRYYG